MYTHTHTHTLTPAPHMHMQNKLSFFFTSSRHDVSVVIIMMYTSRVDILLPSKLFMETKAIEWCFLILLRYFFFARVDRYVYIYEQRFWEESFRMTPFYKREPPPRREQKEEENKLDQWLSEIFLCSILLILMRTVTAWKIPKGYDVPQRRNNNKWRSGRELVWCGGEGGWSGQISKENQKRKKGNALIFSFDLPEHAKRDLQFKRARRKL